MMKRLRFIFVLIILAVAAAVFVLSQQPAGWLEVDFLDVGQGDSILIKAPQGQTVLIDGGPDQQVLAELAHYLPWWDKEIDLMILTHPHADHVTGLNYVLENYQVSQVMATGVSHTSANYLNWLATIKEKKIPLTIVDSPRQVVLGDCQLNIIWPRENLLNKTVDNLNNTSIVSQLNCGQTVWLLTGDLESDGEAALLASGLNLKAQVLKVGHHGSLTANSLAWLEAIQPDWAIISAGKDNSYGLPKQTIIERLENLGATVWRTDQQGSLQLSTDGQLIW